MKLDAVELALMAAMDNFLYVHCHYGMRPGLTWEMILDHLHDVSDQTMCNPLARTAEISEAEQEQKEIGQCLI